MRSTSNGLELRWQTGVSRFALIEGLMLLLIAATAGCGYGEPDTVVEPTVSGVTSASAPAPDRSALPVRDGFSIH